MDLTKDNFEYYRGDHWSTWTGPTVSSVAGGGQALEEIKRAFQSCNFIEECVDRYVDSLIGKFPTWYLKTESGDRADSSKDARASEAEILLQRWIDQVSVRSMETSDEGSDVWIDSVTNLAVDGKGVLRLWTPKRFSDAPDPVDRIHLSLVRTGQLRVDRDHDGFLSQIHYGYGSKGQLYRYDGDRLVVEGDDVPDGHLRLDLGGRWPISFMTSKSLITPHVKRLQDGVNRALTMMGRNSVLAAFLERIFLNAQSPGHWEESETGEPRFVPDPHGLASGGGVDTFISGVPQSTSDGLGTTLATPQLYVREPVNPDAFLKEIDGYRSLIYYQFSQGHLLNSSNAAMSGVSRIEMRQDFIRKLARPKRIIEGAIANTLTVVCALLGYPEFQAVVTLNLNSGRTSPEEQRTIIQLYEKQLLSRATAMGMLGISDSDAEIQLILSEQADSSKSEGNSDVEQ